MSFLQNSPFVRPKERPAFYSLLADSLPLVALMVAVSVWLWPIGIGGRMPVGGDSTQFSMGLMAVLADALRAGRLPLWNAHWGFGFPGLAESQMGVYYPPHAILYRFLSLEAAYTASLVLHTYWAALGTYWAARRFGVSRWGSALAGFAWSASGMFVIHLPHQWGYTTGSWMPWAIGLGWIVFQDERKLRHACLLAAVLTLQILPGHFQFAFETQVLLGLMATWKFLESPRENFSSAAWVGLALAATFPLAAAQLSPTWQLAQSAQSQRTFDYLSAFPATPIHLSSYVAPNLFYLSPLWRPLAWDPFHAMPEEHRPYLGLVPLMLGLGTIRRHFRADRGVRLLTILAVASLLLSLGPYIPGFSLLIRLPGFSFFRAPARWGLATLLMMAILAGRGFDSWKSWPRIGRSTLRFTLIAALVPLLLVGVLELAFASSEGFATAKFFDTAMRFLPWAGDPSFRQVMDSTRRGPRDALILTNLISQGIEPRVAASMRLDRERISIYVRELAETAILLGSLLGIAFALARKSRYANTLLLVFAVTDLLLLSRHRVIATAPIQPLTEQSAVLAKLAKLPIGSRTVDGFRNLPMVAHAAPLNTYRTLDRPVMTALISLASAAADGSVNRSLIVEAMRVLGVSIRVIDPLEASNKMGEAVKDPVLASWLYGQWGPKAPAFRLWSQADGPPRAFLVQDIVPETTNPTRILQALRDAPPLRFVQRSPEEFEVEGDSGNGGVVVVSVLDDPEWEVTDLTTRELVTRRAGRTFATPNGGAWQSVTLEGGPIFLRWTYRGQAASLGIKISAAAWSVWLMGVVWSLRSRRASKIRVG